MLTSTRVQRPRRRWSELHAGRTGSAIGANALKSATSNSNLQIPSAEQGASPGQPAHGVWRTLRPQTSLVTVELQQQVHFGNQAKGSRAAAPNSNLWRSSSGRQQAFGAPARQRGGTGIGRRPATNVYEDYAGEAEDGRHIPAAHRRSVPSAGLANPVARSTASLQGSRRALAPNSSKQGGSYGAGRVNSALSSQRKHGALLDSYSHSIYNFGQQQMVD